MLMMLLSKPQGECHMDLQRWHYTNCGFRDCDSFDANLRRALHLSCCQDMRRDKTIWEGEAAASGSKLTSLALSYSVKY